MLPRLRIRVHYMDRDAVCVQKWHTRRNTLSAVVREWREGKLSRIKGRGRRGVARSSVHSGAEQSSLYIHCTHGNHRSALNLGAVHCPSLKGVRRFDASSRPSPGAPHNPPAPSLYTLLAVAALSVLSLFDASALLRPFFSRWFLRHPSTGEHNLAQKKFLVTNSVLIVFYETVSFLCWLICDFFNCSTRGIGQEWTSKYSVILLENFFGKAIYELRVLCTWTR